MSNILFLLLFLPLFAIYAKTFTIQRHITFSNNDAEEHANGSMYLNSSDLEMCWEEDVQAVGLRFTNIDIPKNAFIKNAYIQFETDEPSEVKTILNIYVQDDANPTFFTNTPLNITSRKRFSKKIIWKPPPWRETDQRKKAQRTPDLSILIQHIIDKKDWKKGNSLVFIIRGAGKRVAKAFIDNQENSIKSTPSLHISYSLKPFKQNKKNFLYKKSNLFQKIVINEILALNKSTNYDPDYKRFSDWIELKNQTDKTIDLKGFYLSNDWKNPKKWCFSKSVKIKPKSYLLIWADKADGELKAIHTNFKLNRKKGEVILSDKNGYFIDEISYPKQSYDISYSRGQTNYYFSRPTPNRQNLPGLESKKRSNNPIFSLPSGFYDKCVNISLSSEKKAKIYYTTNGSNPSINSPLYKKPIKICKNSVIKAIAIEKNRFQSPVVMHTYLIKEKVSLPVVSIGVDKKYLFDKEIGIISNYEKDWLRPASIEYIENGKSCFMKNIGLKINGNNTRSYPQKSFAIIFKKKFGDKILKYRLFKDKPYINKIKSFILRNSGTYWGGSLISEGVSHRIVMKNMDIDAQAYQPCVLFLNGEYYGIYNIREKMNKDYIKSNYKIKKKIDLIEHDEFYDTVKSGNIDAWYELIDNIRIKNIRDKKNYNDIISKIDLDEFINHIITESYFANSSIRHNVKRWRIRGKNGKWRTLLFDLDRGFRNPKDKVLGYLLDNSPANLLFTYLIQNQAFKTKFLSRYFSHLNTTFKPNRVKSFIKKAAKDIQKEIPRHFRRWPRDKDGNLVSFKTWQKKIKSLYRFADFREKIVRKKLREIFDLKGESILNIFTNKKASFYIDDIPITGEFKGKYFKNAVVTIKTIPKKGCKFIKYSNGKKENEIRLILKKDTNISAQIECKNSL